MLSRPVAAPGGPARITRRRSSRLAPALLALSLHASTALALDCSAPAGVIDFGAGASVDLAGNTTTGSVDVDTYGCGAAGAHDGAELVYELVLPWTGRIIVVEAGVPSGLSFLVLSACDESACVDATGCSSGLPAGLYYLVVDGPAGFEGPFAARIVLEEIPNRWDLCEGPSGSTQLTDTVRTLWEFDDGDYCFQDGCSFAMYVAAPCGNDLHVVTYDVETATIQVMDVLRKEYVPLSARSTGGFAQAGTRIQWVDCSGSDPLFNNQTMDIHVQPTGATCGVYRIDFEFVGGFVWTLAANCTGADAPDLLVHDSACGAFAAYASLPDLRLVAASATPSCPDVDVTYTVENTGCAEATDVAVTLFDDGVPVAVDTIPVVAPGTRATLSFTATFPVVPTGVVTLALDAADAILECAEVPGAACVAPVDEFLVVDGCPDPPSCSVGAVAAALPATICPGELSTIDAAASTQSACAGGVLEYQLRLGIDTLVPWGGTPLFPGLSPPVTSTFEVDVRCADPASKATCVDTTTVTISLANGCPACAVDADASVTPPTSCLGGSATIDASAATQVSCPGAVLEHQLRSGGATLVPWQASPLFAGLSPAVTTDYDVDSRCADPTQRDTCVATATATLTVDGGCPTCGIGSVPVATPAMVCPGEPVVIELSASTQANCPGLVLEYQLRRGGSTIAAWQRSSRFTVLAPAATTDYEADVRCADPASKASCIDTERVTISIDPSCAACVVDADASVTPPTICLGDSATIDASTTTQASCPGGLLEYQLRMGATPVVSWQEDPTFAGLSPDETTDYDVDVRCADAALQATCVDTTTVTLSVIANDPALLPRVGTSLRVGAPEAYSETVVPLRWTASRPLGIAEGEHVHVLRSSRPDGGFVQINLPDPPLLQLGAHLDADADLVGPPPQVQHYLVFVADTCHVDNRAVDRFTTP